ncbi:peptide chain release factor N(5)-glutamine methyltransferase [Chloroflexota bacterium]
MILKKALGQARGILTENDIEDASLEGELLLRHALDTSRVQLYLDLHRELSPEHEEVFWKLIQRRLNGEPSAYITGQREFYGNNYYVNPNVLIPRPESELLVEEAIHLARQSNISTIAEIGTGCGAIAISLALSLPEVRLYATDISASALKVARFNAENYAITDRLYLLEGDMLAPLPEPVDLIVANLPYVRESELPPTGEPVQALNGGPDGLSKIYDFCHKISGKLSCGGSVLLEIGQGQGNAVANLLRNLFPSARIEITPDLSGIERMVSLRLT